MLTIKVTPQPQLARKGYVDASLRSNVGALLDVFVVTQVGKGAHWTTGTPAEARPGSSPQVQGRPGPVRA